MNANGGVVIYGNKVQYSKSGFEDVPATGPTANSGSKALCFCGNNNLVYKQPNTVTLPAGSYKMTISVYPYNGAYSSEQPTTKVKDFSGFVDVNGTEYFSKNRSTNKEITLNSNKWNNDIIEFELTQTTTGHFQVSYGIQYFLVIDDVKLEYQGGVITTSLQTVVDKAQTLNGMLNDANLSDAIQTAQNFISNPTTQDDVATTSSVAPVGTAVVVVFHVLQVHTATASFTRAAQYLHVVNEVRFSHNSLIWAAKLQKNAEKPTLLCHKLAFHRVVEAESNALAASNHCFRMAKA
jgi:hypothetical protein